jgi:transcriptional regulator with XRE-family HTH domain
MRKPSKIDQRLGTMIRSQREDAKMTLAALGEKVGVAHNAIAKYERGEVPLTVARLFAICKALGVKPTFFIMYL